MNETSIIFRPLLNDTKVMFDPSLVKLDPVIRACEGRTKKQTFIHTPKPTPTLKFIYIHYKYDKKNGFKNKHYIILKLKRIEKHI